MSADATVDGLASVGNQRRVVRQTVVEPEEGSEVHVAVTDGHGDCLRPVERDEQHLVGRRVTVDVREACLQHHLVLSCQPYGSMNTGHS